MQKTNLFRTLQELDAFANGGIQGGPGREKFDLDGLTLTFSSPAASVTFSGNGLSIKAVNEQLQVAIPSLKVVVLCDHLWILEITPTNGVAIASDPFPGTEDARSILGFSKTAEYTGLVLDDPAGTAPKRVRWGKAPGGMWELVWESA
jgi:hypothetical protein